MIEVSCACRIGPRGEKCESRGTFPTLFNAARSGWLLTPTYEHGAGLAAFICPSCWRKCYDGAENLLQEMLPPLEKQSMLEATMKGFDYCWLPSTALKDTPPRIILPADIVAAVEHRRDRLMRELAGDKPPDSQITFGSMLKSGQRPRYGDKLKAILSGFSTDSEADTPVHVPVPPE